MALAEHAAAGTDPSPEEILESLSIVGCLGSGSNSAVLDVRRDEVRLALKVSALAACAMHCAPTPRAATERSSAPEGAAGPSSDSQGPMCGHCLRRRLARETI